METKLLLNDELTLDMIVQFLGVSHMQMRVIPDKKFTVVVDLSDDRLYILTRTGKQREGKEVFKISRIYIWSRLIEILLTKGKP
jgi:hypothetical protein